MPRWLNRKFFPNAAIFIATTVVTELLFNKRLRSSVKKKFLTLKDYLASLVVEGSEAYRKGKDNAAKLRCTKSTTDYFVNKKRRSKHGV